MSRRVRIGPSHHPMKRCPLVLVLPLLVLPGCTTQRVETEYGRISTSASKESVNGANVFSAMFERFGARVTSARRLHPGLERADCIVWIPDDFDVPEEDVLYWFEEWLEAEPGRTLIYVARDYDAAVEYWREVLDDFDSQEARAEAAARLMEARSEYSFRRGWGTGQTVCEWFSLEPGLVQKAEELTSDAGWLDGVDAAKTDLRLGRFPSFDDSFEPLLSTRKGPFVARSPRCYGDSQLIVVANGSFLLNYSLVNHEHRKLAAELIETAGPGERVVFVESGFGGLQIAEDDKPSQTPWEIVTRFPFNWMLGQFTVLGILFCFSRWPVFGRPKRIEQESLTDFGRHITALGRLLRDNRDAAFAAEEVRKYHEEAGRPRTQ